MQSISPGSRPARAIASREAFSARSAGVSPATTQRRSAMPERWRIHSSLVSISASRSLLVTRRSGTHIPVPLILARSISPPSAGPQRGRLVRREGAPAARIEDPLVHLLQQRAEARGVARRDRHGAVLAREP